MTLASQTVEVPFEGGLDTNTSSKKVIPGKLLELENAVFVGGEIQARPGTQVLGDGVLGGGTLADAKALSVVGGELLRWASGGVYGRSSAAAPWVQRGDTNAANPLSYTVSPIAQRPYSCQMFGCASLLGVTVYVWTELNSGFISLMATVVDETTGVRYQDAVSLAGPIAYTSDSQLWPRVLACGGSIVVLYGQTISSSAAALNAFTLQPGTPQTFVDRGTLATMKRRLTTYAGPFVLAATDLTTGTVTASTTGRLALAYSATTGGINVQQFSVPPGSSINSTTPATVNRVPSGGVDPDAYDSGHLLTNGARSRLFLLFRNVANADVELHTLDAATHALVATGYVFSGSTPFSQFKATALEKTTGTHTVYFECIDTTSAPLYYGTWTDAGAITQTAVTWRFGVRLGGRAFTFNGKNYLPCLYHDMWGTSDVAGVQPTFFLLDADTGSVVARALAGVAGGPLNQAPILAPALISASGTTVAITVPTRTRVEYEADTGTVIDVTTIGLSRLTLSVADPGTVQRIEENGALHIGGANPRYYDGASWTSDGFHVSPEHVTVSLGSSGSLSAGTYSWVVCYEWVDALGRLHRSAPSVPVTATATAGQLGSVTVPFLHLTTKTNVRLALYRTIANGTVLYRTTRSINATVQAAVVNSNTWMISDNASDTSIQDNEVLPFGGVQGGTTGGELWHRPTPGYSVIHRHGAYLFALLMDDGQRIAYSLPLTDGEGPTFPDELRMVVPSTHGKAVGLATLDDKLLILCESGVYVVFGQGPLLNGTDNGFTEPAYITGSVGCLSAASIVQTADGIMYQSPNGFVLLSRGLETSLLGAGVQAYKGLTVSRALEVPNRREVRFYTQEGRTLVYSTEWRQWGTWTGQPARDAVLFGSVPYFADGTHVRYEDTTITTEAGAAVSIVVGSAWLKWAGMQGLQRIWRALLLGTAQVTTTMTSDVFYDYDDSAPGTTNTATFSGSSVGGPAAFQVSQHLSKQLCRALRFRWTLTPAPTGGSDKGTLGLTSLTLEFGAHRAPAKRGRRTL